MTLRIERIGAEGDGVAHLPDATPVYVPRSLPDELVSATILAPLNDGWLAQVDDILEPRDSRVAPPCPHFARCGGCALQHWRQQDYQAWKAGLLTQALHRAGFTEAAVALQPGAPQERRRIDFAVRRTQGQIVLGLHAARSAEVLDIAECPILRPELMALIAPLRAALSGLDGIRREASALINLLDSGPDLLLRTDAALTVTDRATLTNFSRQHDLCRVSVAERRQEPETVCLLRPATTRFSGVTVTVPPGGFLQATSAGEDAIVAAVLRGLPDKLSARARVAELYAGCGTLTFALAQRTQVTAFEGDPSALAALRHAVNHCGLAGRVRVEPRDLTRQPLSEKDLAAFAAVVLDPPHAGAAAQIAMMAAAWVPTIIYVSCNPATLSRDARTLHQAGYRLLAATAIDQFFWSARLEAVCVFRRG